jgi:predicted RNA methylase
MQRVKTFIRKIVFGNEQRAFAVHAGLLRGLTFEIDVRVDTQQITGLYEREIQTAVRRFASRASTALDIGAGDGYYTLYFASRPGIRKVIACEPDPKRIGQLERNLGLNPSCEANKVSVRPVCVGIPGAQDLETLIQNTPEPVLLKIDVEGAELEVLESGKDCLARRDLMLIIETHSLALERECIDFLKRLGYECRIRKNGWYRKIVPELRHLPHNRWLVAERANRALSHHTA